MVSVRDLFGDCLRSSTELGPGEPSSERGRGEAGVFGESGNTGGVGETEDKADETLEVSSSLA